MLTGGWQHSASDQRPPPPHAPVPQAEDKKKGGIDLHRFQELYAQFIGNPDETIGAVYLFGPLQELN